MTADTVGGVWQYATDLAAALTQGGEQVTLAILGPPASADQLQTAEAAGCTVLDTGLPLDWLSNGPVPVKAAAVRLAQLAEAVGADLVHCNHPAYAGGAAWPVPVIAVAHGCISTWWRAARGGSVEPAFDWHAELTRAGLLAADIVVAPSGSYANDVQATYALPHPPITVHNGRAARPAVTPARHDLFALTVGRLWDEVKQAPLLDRVAAQVDLPFLAAGSLRAPHGAETTLHHLRTLGAMPAVQLDALLAARPIFVSAASFEPFGLAVLEAAAAGCPLVLADTPSFRELWDGAAMFVPVASEQAYVEAVEALARDPARREQLGHAAQQRARRYTPENTAAAMAALYDQVQPQRVAA
ncbi:glycosyltransferase family 4 protein [Croceibacterium ferulae]|uniref:glycosyltransferase family 4 protein n=1 Tax=Croceibacterium ferulae TaxID=1854641 RepID=UPI0013900D7D|nr:glycosyltransferase family 4 protein [Croceibacterium ferulae]